LFSDKDRLEFGVVVSDKAKFSERFRICPSKEAPTREPGEPQSWISVNDELLSKVLEDLKRIVFSVVHNRPTIAKVTSRLTIFSNKL
jgi:hypothetical protein